MALDLECRRMAMDAWKRSIRTVGAVAASAGVLAIVLGLLVLAVRPMGGQAAGGVSAEGGPRFRADGPDADSFGRGEGYPICKGPEYARQRCRIGAFSHFDQLFPSRTIKAPAAPTAWAAPRWSPRSATRTAGSARRSISISTSTR